MTLPTEGVFVVDSTRAHAVHAVSLSPDGMGDELAVVVQVAGHANHNDTTEERPLILRPEQATRLAGQLLTALDTVRKHAATPPE